MKDTVEFVALVTEHATEKGDKEHRGVGKSGRKVEMTMC